MDENAGPSPAFFFGNITKGGTRQPDARFHRLLLQKIDGFIPVIFI